MPKKNPKRDSLRYKRAVNANQTIGTVIRRGGRNPSKKQSRQQHLRTQERYLDVLQSIEFVIAGVYEEFPDLTDRDVLVSLQVLDRSCWEEPPNNPPVLRPRLRNDFPPNSKPLAYETAKRISRVLSKRFEAGLQPRTNRVLHACLDCIRDSVEFWNQRDGIRGYLDYISDYL